MARKFAHLTAQMKTEKRISRQLEAAANNITTSTTTNSVAAPRVTNLQRSSSSGSSSNNSPHRHNFHSTSCRHYSGSREDRVDSPAKLRSSSQDIDAGNDSSSSNSNQVIDS